MTRHQAEQRLAALSFRLKYDGPRGPFRWIVYQDSQGMAREIATLSTLAEVSEFISIREMMNREEL